MGQEYWLYETAPLRNLQDEAAAPNVDLSDHDHDPSEGRIVNQTTVRQRVCVLRNPETGELVYRPVEDCYQNGAEEVTPPEAPDGVTPPLPPAPQNQTETGTETPPENPEEAVPPVTPPEEE